MSRVQSTFNNLVTHKHCFYPPDGCKLQRQPSIVRPEKWGDPQVGFQGSNASGGRIVLLPAAFWAHCASKMAILGASLLLCVLQYFRASEGMLPPGACRSSRASAKCIVSCRGLCASSLCPQVPHAPAPTFGGF